MLDGFLAERAKASEKSPSSQAPLHTLIRSAEAGLAVRSGRVKLLIPQWSSRADLDSSGSPVRLSLCFDPERNAQN